MKQLHSPVGVEVTQAGRQTGRQAGATDANKSLRVNSETFSYVNAGYRESLAFGSNKWNFFVPSKVQRQCSTDEAGFNH